MEQTRNRRSRNRRRKQTAFTLIEVLLVLVILVVLGSMAAGLFSGTQDRALRNAAKGQLGIFDRQIELYRFDIKKYPSSLQDLVEKPSDSAAAKNWTSPYIKGGKIPLDPWDNEYRFSADGSTYKVWSMGPDGQDGSDDDITNEDS
ncbi:Type II secretion system protein G precursor [Pseudobythopirellula maris]|uniref:Type II secretion system core protein G n=1 Tax=Pseudobythopirellula maris TaxID=2527991 RepID=A0A5C5ZRL0_9BACT|nr:type II secretion system major pseudopilin GspG [Pseudobythopirellula maris]TWT90149.1 Type II secretion system protein G precursor [Pseudobythopirellula maris]